MTLSPKDDRFDHAAITRRILVGILVLLAIGFLYLSREFLLPIILALLIAITLRPAVRWLSQRGIPAWATASLFAVLLLMLGFVLGYVISGAASGWIAEAPAIANKFAIKLHTISGSFERVAKVTEVIKAAGATVPGAATEVIVKEPALPALFWMALYPATYSLMFVSAVILSLFLMASGDLLLEKILNVLSSLRDKKHAVRIVLDVEHEVSVYLVTHSAINAGVGIAVGSLFYFAGMPTAYLWAFVAFVLNFIPYVGPLTGVVVSGVFSFALFDSLTLSLLPPFIYLVIIMIEGQLITPHLLGRKLRMNSLAILLSLSFWGWIWGVPGIIVAIPLLVTLRVFCDHFAALTEIGEFLGEAAVARTTINQKIIESGETTKPSN